MSASLLWRSLKEAAARVSADKLLRMAAALAYYSIFTMAPLLLIVIWVAGAVFGADAARGALFDELEGTLGAPAAATVEQALDAVYRTDGGIWATITGILLVVVGASGAFLELQDALNTIFQAPAQASSGVWSLIQTRLLSFALVVSCGFLLLVSLVVSTALTALQRTVGASVPGGVLLGQVLNIVVSLLVIGLLFTLILKVLPDVRLRWRDAALGGTVTAVLFTIGKFLIGLYLAHGSVASAYGAAGTLVVWLLWVYYSSLIVLFGAELTRSYTRLRGPAPAATPPVPAAQRARPVPIEV